MPRLTTAIASKYQRARIHSSSFMRGEITTFGVNYAGVLEDGVLITAVTWYTNQNVCLIIGPAGISDDQKSVTLDVTMGWGGFAWLTCTATFSDGQARVQAFQVRVADAQFVQGQPTPAQGPTSASAVAPIAPEPEFVEADTLVITEDGGETQAELFLSLLNGAGDACTAMDGTSVTITSAELSVYSSQPTGSEPFNPCTTAPAFAGDPLIIMSPTNVPLSLTLQDGAWTGQVEFEDALPEGSAYAFLTLELTVLADGVTTETVEAWSGVDISE